MSLTFIDGKYNSICLGKHSPGEMNPSVASLVESNVLLSVYRLWQSKAFAVRTTSTCPACRVMELSIIANRAANEATQYFCKAIRCTEMPWLTPKFLMQCGCQLIDNLPCVLLFRRWKREVCYKYQPSGSRPFSPFLPPNFLYLNLI